MTKKFKQFCQLIAIILAIAIPMQCLPLQAIALTPMSESSYVTEGSYDELSDEPIGEVNEPTVLGEDTSRRSEYVKHYILSDKSYRAVFYNEPVHYKKDGAWLEIDRSLSYEEATDSEDTAGFANKADSFRVKFANNSNSSKLMRIRKGDYELSWGYVKGENTNKSTATPDEQSGKVTYADIEPDTDLIYKVTGSGIKENIVVSSKQDSYSYTFQLKTKGLSLTKNEDGSISANDAVSGETVFTIPAPFMYDAEDRYSNAVEYTLSETNNNKIQLTVTADKEWINSENRAFPVTIDPIIHTKQSKKVVDSTMVASSNAYKNVNFSGNGATVIGYESSEYNASRAIVKIDIDSETDILQKGDMIVSATLAMHQYKHSFYSSTTPDLYINAHLVNKAYNSSTVTWSNQPTFDSEIYDYIVIQNGYSTNGDTISKWHQFDITEAVKGWYEGTIPNYGILLKQSTETANTANAYFHSENNTVTSNAIPLIQIDYRSNRGLEDYWTYTSVGAGAAGTASINDYSGNMVFTAPIFTSPGERLNISLNGIYNGYTANDIYAVGKSNSALTSLARGWRLSIQQTLLPSNKFGLTDTASIYPYVYTDGDGTDHYFKKLTENGSTVYRDEDGLGLVLTVSGSTYTITDEKNNVLKFNSAGNMYEAVSNGDRILITYYPAQTAAAANNASDIAAGTRIKTIQDAADHMYTFHYYKKADGSTNNFVASITDESGNAYTFTRDSNNCLAKITYPDGTKSSFTYDSASRLLKTVTDNEDYQLVFTNTSQKTGYRVSSVTEYSAKDSSGARLMGQKMTFDRTLYNTTVIRTPGRDAVYGGGNDIITTLQFDNFGRTTSKSVSYANKEHIGATSAVYSEATDTTIKKHNKITSSSSLGKNVVNLLTNGNVESETGWTITSSNADGQNYTSPSIYYYGHRSIMIHNSEASTDNESYRRYEQNVSGLNAGGTYTLSGYVKVTSFTQKYTSTYNGAYLSLHTIGGTPNTAVGSECLTAVTSNAIDNGWRRLSVKITLPEDCTSLKVALHMRNCTGTAYFDGIQLEEGSTPHAFNMLENSSFEKVSSGMPTGWTARSVTDAGTVSFSNASTTAYSNHGTYSMRILGEVDKYKYLCQTVNVSGNPDDTYIISGWARANAVEKTFHSEANFGLTAYVIYDNGAGGTYKEYKTPVNYNTTVDEWQYGSQSFALKSTAHPSYKPLTLTICPHYNMQTNYGYFDNIQLIKDVAQSYTYDNEGNVISVSANAEQKSNMTYEDADLKSITDSAGYAFSYGYDSQHNVSSATSARGLLTSFERLDWSKLITDTEVSNPLGTNKIKTHTQYTPAQYDSSGQIDTRAYAHVLYTTDQHGNKTEYTYDYKRGRMLTAKDPKGNITSYDYVSGADDRIKQVTSGGSSVTYNYTGNLLSSLKFGNNTYSFANDRFGNSLTTKINGKLLSENFYGENNGLLNKIFYGNGYEKKYYYNSLGLVSSVGLDIKDGTDSTDYAWYYDTTGTLLKHVDGIADREYRYTYDSIGRHIRTTIHDQNNPTVELGSYEYTYDIRNNIQRLDIIAGGRDFTQAHFYTAISGRSETESYTKDNLVSRFYMNSTQYADYYYDSLNRLNKRKFSTTRPIVNNYMYKVSEGFTDTVNDGIDSVYRTTQLSTEIIDNTAYGHYYDKNGNITLIKKGVRTNPNTEETGSSNFSNYRSYGYDALNQLISEFNYTTGDDIAYTYDASGNMTSRTVTNESTGNTTTVTYIYTADPDSDGDGSAEAGWADMLTQIRTVVTDSNGNVISDTVETADYDAIGNPTSYRGKTLSWAGRNLLELNEGTNEIKYKYDSDGLRTYKDNNGVISRYMYIGNKVVYEKNGDKDIYLWYDSYGNLAAVQVNEGNTSLRAFATTNAQGDVLGLYDASGNQIVSYEYDSWGNLISMSDTSDIGIGTINPIRYRGYYFDEETGFYYLQSRYYDPQTGRFINADCYVSTGQDLLGNNMFIYCGNNPVMYVDPSGEYKIINNNFIRIEKGDTLWDIAADLTGNGLNWTKLDYKGDPQNLYIGQKINISGFSSILLSKKRPNFTPRKDPKKGSETRQPTGERERNVKPPIGEEHSRVAKGNRSGVRPSANGSKIARDVGIAAGVSVAGYIVYRTIRMIPSLLPTLWWTIPANAATP